MDNSIQVTTVKKGASPNAVKSSHITTKLRAHSGGRRAAGIVAKLAKRGYRPDLRKAAVARVFALTESHKEKKVPPPKKARGKKVAATA